MKYEVDIGKWERGRIVDINAKDPQEAYRKATNLLENDEEVVQIKEKKSRRCRYDYMNGFSIYQD